MALGAGFVYVIGPAEPCEPYRVKIGATNDRPVKRLRTLQVGSPFRLQILHLIRDGNPFSLEEGIHAELAEYRIHGEWFELEGDAVAVVETAASAVRLANRRVDLS